MIARAEKDVLAAQKDVKKVEQMPLAPMMKQRAVPWKAATKAREKSDRKTFDAAQQMLQSQNAVRKATKKYDDTSKTLHGLEKKVQKWEHALNR